MRMVSKLSQLDAISCVDCDMQYVWNGDMPWRDGDLEAGIVIRA